MSLEPYPDLPDAGASPTGDEVGDRSQLSEADSRLLDALTRAQPQVVTAVEDQVRPVPSGQGDAAAPLPGPVGRGPLTPVFQEPVD